MTPVPPRTLAARTRPWPNRLASAVALAVALVLVPAVPVAHGANLPFPVTALAFPPDGSRLVSAGPRAISWHSPTDGSLIRRVDLPLDKINALAFAPGGKLLAVAGGLPARSGTLLLLGPLDAPPLRSWTHGSDLLTGLAFDSTGKTLVVASAGDPPQVLAVGPDGSTLVERFPLIGHSGPVLTVAMSSDDRWIVTAGADRSVKVWDAANGSLARSLSQHTEAIHALAFRPVPLSPPSRVPGIVPPDEEPPAPRTFCATAGEDRTVRIWQPALGRMVRIVRGHESGILALSYSIDGAFLFAAGKEGRIRRIDADSDAILETWNDHEDWITALAASPDGRRLASGDASGRVNVRKLAP